VRVLNESFVMGYGRQGRGGSTSRQESNESSREKKENKPAETDVSADEIRRMVAKFLKELSGSTNPRKAPRLLNKISEEKIRALGFMSKLKYVTEPELIDKYIEAEARRKEWFESQGWDYTPNVDPKRLPLMSYDSVADIHGQTVQPEDKHDAFVTFMGTSDGPLRLAEYDKMICAALLVAFGKRTINSTMKLFGDICIQVNGSERLLDDVITYVGKLATVNHDLGDLEPDELQQVIEVLNTGLSKAAPALGLDMRTDTEGKGYSVDQYCEILVDKATKRMEATDAFADWEKDKSKGNRPLSDAERLRLNDLEKEVARLKKENAQLLKAAKPNNPSTSASAVGNKGCFKCGKEGHRADQCPDIKPTPTKTAPATPRTAGAKSAGQSGKKVSFSKLQLDTAVKNTVQETVAAMEKKGWQKP
jgi:hypothetical protein